jgi:uncharacterized protein
MTLSLHAASVPVFSQMLGSLDALLAKADAHVAERKLDPAALLQARLYPDMFPFLRQVQVACEFAKSVCGRLAGVELPVEDDAETTFQELRGRVARTLNFIKGLDAAAFDAATDREILLRPGTPKERRIDAPAYLLSYGLPQFFFHATTAYALLRHNGVEIGKKDFMGAY